MLGDDRRVASQPENRLHLAMAWNDEDWETTSQSSTVEIADSDGGTELP